MLYEWLVEHRITEANYWWFVNKRLLVRRLLAQHRKGHGVLLEVGSGGGLLSAVLAGDGWRVISADLFPEAAQFAREHGVREALAFAANQGWPLADASIDAFVMLDALEHVEGDADCLAEACRVLRPGGLGIVSVPAYQFLFSSWDEYNGHYRRYTRGMLARAAADAGLQVVRTSYWNAVSLPPAVVLRWKDRIRGVKIEKAEYPKVPGWVDAALRGIGRMECAWIARWPMPAGLSAIAVLRKDGEAR